MPFHKLGGFAYNWQSKWVVIITIKAERTQIHFLSDVLVAVASLDLKVPNSQKWGVTYSIGFVSNFSAAWLPTLYSDCYMYVTYIHVVTICPNILSKSWCPKIAVDVHCSNSVTSFSDDLFCIACKVRDSGRRLCIVIVAEGAQDDSGNPVTSYDIREVRRLVITKLPSKLSAIIKLRSNLY